MLFFSAAHHMDIHTEFYKKVNLNDNTNLWFTAAELPESCCDRKLISAVVYRWEYCVWYITKYVSSCWNGSSPIVGL